MTAAPPTGSAALPRRLAGGDRIALLRGQSGLRLGLPPPHGRERVQWATGAYTLVHRVVVHGLDSSARYVPNFRSPQVHRLD
ncbi:hypothetical protein [Streptomyces sp. NPDC051109]|uniref:hypothetical protein n=1 Tax=Streptomyces sp. NPDC051109 TaxID=3365642 RepID=UPI0010662055